MRGTVRRLMLDKGFGFLKPDDNSPDCFFHRSAVDGVTGKIFENYREGDAVEFDYDPNDNDKGPRARTVRTV